MSNTQNEFNAHFRVDPDVHPALEAVTRFQSIRRWHMIDTCRAQSIAEHSANVALLAYYLCVSAPGGYFGPAVGALLPSLTHDIPEVFTGDIPAHTKKYIMGVDELEEKLTPACFRSECSDDLALLIKLCDLADGIRFIERYGVDRVAVFATDGLRDQLNLKMLRARAQWPDHVYESVNDKITTYLLL